MCTTEQLPVVESCSGRAEQSACDCEGCPNRAERTTVVDAKSQDNNAFLGPEERVLPTLDHDGKRRWLSPKLATGRLWRARRVVSYVLMVVFLVAPHLRWNGRPLILLDIANREFLLFGTQFLPTDTPLLAIVLIASVLSVIFATAVFGRVWCGWACPQTVYMEFLFRPIDRWFEGTSGRGGKPRKAMPPWKRVARVGVYVVLSVVIANSFLAFFVGTDALSEWVRSSPLEHPAAFLVMTGVTIAFVADFLWFREQFCTVACPYGRFQSVMLDEQSLVVAYDQQRGEPRIKGKRAADRVGGDCVDCNQCVVVCPTGIDIRDGLQMECINCTQCVDACDSVMTKLNMPTGLIRLTSQDSLAGRKRRFWRARTVVYPVLICALGVLFVSLLGRTSGFNATFLRGAGQPFVVQEHEVSNSVRVRLVNRTNTQQTYNIAVTEPAGVEASFLGGSPVLAAQGTTIAPVLLTFPVAVTQEGGVRQAVLKLTDGSENKRELIIQLLGPGS